MFAKQYGLTYSREDPYDLLGYEGYESRDKSYFH